MYNVCEVHIAWSEGLSLAKHKLCQKSVGRDFSCTADFIWQIQLLQLQLNLVAKSVLTVSGLECSISSLFPPERSLLSWYFSFYMIMLLLKLRVAIQKNPLPFPSLWAGCPPEDDVSPLED